MKVVKFSSLTIFISEVDIFPISGYCPTITPGRKQSRQKQQFAPVALGALRVTTCIFHLEILTSPDFLFF